MRLIDADALRAEFPMPKDITDPNQVLVHITGIWAEIDNAPTIEERKTGKWIKLDAHAHLADHKCTACGQECYVPTCMGDPMYEFCPNCGAKMDGGQTDE